MITVDTPRCHVCGNGGTVEVRTEDYVNWAHGGELAQNAFPYLDNGKREQLISGTHDECWNKLFPEE